MISETARPETPAGGRQRRWTRWVVKLAGLLSFLVVGGLLILLLVTLAAPRLWGYQTYVIYGSSMEPTIKVGSLIVAKAVSADDLEVGDVVTFRGGNDTTVTHRITGIRHEDGQRHFLTRGDASNGADPLETRLEGDVARLAYHLPYLGYFVHFAKGPLGIILLLALPALGLLALQLTNGRRPRPQAAEAPPEG